MTLRGLGLLTGGALAAVAGWVLGWPEVTVLGVAAVALVVLVVLLTSSTVSVDVRLDTASRHVVRGESASVRVEVSSRRRRRSTRLVEGPPARPRHSTQVPAGRGVTAVAVPVDTSRRGEHQIGPFSVLQGDPWSVVRRVAGRSDAVPLLVRPRTVPVRRGLGASQRAGTDEAMSRRRGEDHFFALRDYVLGDEPRNVHWRSSARSGRLVVKQKVAAASDGTLFVLDVDTTAYGSRDAFSSTFDDDRFEAAVEVVASLCAARVDGVERVMLTTTHRDATVVTAGSAGPPGGVLDALARVGTVAPVDTAPEDLSSLLRSTRASTLVLVTGSPSRATQLGIAAAGTQASALVVRLGDADAPPVPGARVLDLAGPEDLA